MNELMVATVTDYWADLRNGVKELIKAYRYAADAGVSVWQFAVPEGALRQLGMTESDLRWLILKALAQSRLEITRPGDDERIFTIDPSRKHGTSGCFALTEEGFRSLEAIAAKCSSASGFESNGATSREFPHWDTVRHELRFHGQLVKRFRTAAANQERILAAFEEDKWPPRIDDPLPPAAELDPRQRLHDTIRSLNRNQHSPLLRFVGDGTGEGVLWTECDSNGEI